MVDALTSSLLMIMEVVEWISTALTRLLILVMVRIRNRRQKIDEEKAHPASGAAPNHPQTSKLVAGSVKSLTLTILHHLARLFDNLTIWLGCTAGDNAIQLTGTI